MSKFFCLTFLISVWGFAAIGALPRLSFADAGQLRVCFLALNQPFSREEDNSGFDVDVATAVAAEMGRSFAPVWVRNSDRITEVDESDFPLHRLQRGACDAIFSVPGEDAVRGVDGLSIGRAYYGAAFQLVGREETLPSSVRELQQEVVAVQAQTIASFVLEALDATASTFFSAQEALEAVARREVGMAFVWGPTAGWHVKNNPEWRLIFGQKEPLVAARWNEHVATRQPDATLREDIDGALGRLRNVGELDRLAKRYGIPFHSPFDKTYDVMEMFKLSREAARN